MKLGLKLGKIVIEELGIKLEGIELNVEYGIGEAKGAYSLGKKMLEEVPETLEQLKAGALKFREIDKEFDEIIEQEIIDEENAINEKIKKTMESIHREETNTED